MNRTKYSDKVLLEQVRLWEEARDTELEPTPDSSGPSQKSSFAQRLTHRAKGIAEQHHIATARPSRLHGLFIAITSAVFVLLGVLAIINALDQAGNAINVYWLLLVLLGFNGLALLVWLAATLGGGAEGIVGKIPQLLVNLLPKGDSNLSQWLNIVYQRQTGKWRLSVLTHLFWWCYLTAGLLMLIAVLSVRQYDFYWGSTLLSTEQFSHVVSYLSGPLASLGLPAPDQGLLSSSRMGGLAGDQEQRQQWAYFLLSFIVLYGLIPRLLALVICWLLLKRAETHFEPDYYLPYYVQLRHQLMPEGGVSVVVDPDHEPALEASDPKGDPSAHSNIPTEYAFHLLGMELSPELVEKVDINVTSQQTMEQALESTSMKEKHAGNDLNLGIVVHMNNLPDRGVRRKISALVNPVAKDKRWLILLNSLENGLEAKTENQERQEDWFQAARQAQIPMEQVVYTSPEKLRQPTMYQRQQGAD